MQNIWRSRRRVENADNEQGVFGLPWMDTGVPGTGNYIDTASKKGAGHVIVYITRHIRYLPTLDSSERVKAKLWCRYLAT